MKFAGFKTTNTDVIHAHRLRVLCLMNSRKITLL